jgi:uncharacterized membrane protein
MSSAARTHSLFVAAEAFLSFVGAGIAGTLWWADQTRQDVPCSADGGCAIVNASRWSHLDLIFFHNVPVALLGLIGYVLLLSLAMLRLGSENARLDRGLHLLIGLISAGGAVYSWFLQWIAHADIGAFCIWCRSSAIVMTLLFCMAAAEWAAGHRQNLERQKTHG